jgi:hypothetical protein
MRPLQPRNGEQIAATARLLGPWIAAIGAFVMTPNAKTVEDRLATLGIHLPDAPTPFGAYVPAV